MQALGRNSKKGVLEVVPQMKMDFLKGQVIIGGSGDY